MDKGIYGINFVVYAESRHEGEVRYDAPTDNQLAHSWLKYCRPTSA